MAASMRSREFMAGLVGSGASGWAVSPWGGTGRGQRRHRGGRGPVAERAGGPHAAPLEGHGPLTGRRLAREGAIEGPHERAPGGAGAGRLAEVPAVFSHLPVGNQRALDDLLIEQHRLVGVAHDGYVEGGRLARPEVSSRRPG